MDDKGLDRNLKEFRSNMLSGMSPTEAALKTWAGSKATQYKYDQVASIQVTDSGVVVLFARAGEAISPEIRSLEDAIVLKHFDAERLHAEADAAAKTDPTRAASLKGSALSADKEEAALRTKINQAKAGLLPTAPK